MWSWHIWVTDYDISSVIPIMATDVTEQWIPVPLGFCDAETRTSSSTATIHLHIKQAESNKQAIISYNLGTATMSYGNTAPYYEWGRKDPLRPSTGLGNVNKPIYGLYTTPGTISSTAIDVTIRNPHYFNSSNGNTSLELWNVGNTVSSINVNPVIKSIMIRVLLDFVFHVLGQPKVGQTQDVLFGSLLLGNKAAIFIS